MTNTLGPPYRIEKTVGFGTQTVYVVTFPETAPPRLALGIRQPEKMWVGKLPDSTAGETLTTIAGWSPKPCVSLCIRCDDAEALERAIHRYFGVKGCWQTGFVDDVEEFWMEYEKPEHASLGELFTHYRCRAGLTQQVLADAAGFSVDLVQRIEENPGRFAIDIVQNAVNEMGLTLTIAQKG